MQLLKHSAMHVHLFNPVSIRAVRNLCSPYLRRMHTNPASSDAEYDACRLTLTCPDQWWSPPSWTPGSLSLLGGLMWRCSCARQAGYLSLACLEAAPSSRKDLKIYSLPYYGVIADVCIPILHVRSCQPIACFGT